MNFRRSLPALFVSAALLAPAGPVYSQTPSPAAAAESNAGPPAAQPALLLPGTDGNDHNPLDPAGKKGVVLFFVSPYCPTASNFMPEMNSIASDFAASFTFFFVHGDADQKPADVLQHADLMKIKTTVLMDKDQLLVRRTGATITPEAVVIGPEGKSLYQGRVNDLYLGATKRQRQATTRDLRDALEAITGGKPVAAAVPAVGCKITLAAAKPAADAPAGS